MRSGLFVYGATIHVNGAVMDASGVDLRYKMSDVLKARDRSESVRVLHRGKVRGVIHPPIRTARRGVCDHPCFGSCPAGEPVSATMNRLRGGRRGAL